MFLKNIHKKQYIYLIRIFLFIQIIISVSYTHLDVYKRQMQHATGRTPFTRGGASDAGGRVFSASWEAVSYTHLQKRLWAHRTCQGKNRRRQHHQHKARIHNAVPVSYTHLPKAHKSDPPAMPGACVSPGRAYITDVYKRQELGLYGEHQHIGRFGNFAVAGSDGDAELIAFVPLTLVSQIPDFLLLFRQKQGHPVIDN